MSRIGTIDSHYGGIDPTLHTFDFPVAQDAPSTREPEEGEIILFGIEEALNHPLLHPFTRRIIELLVTREPFTGSARIGPGPEYAVKEYTIEK